MPGFACASEAGGARPATGVGSTGLVFDRNLLDAPTRASVANERGSKPAEVASCGLVFDLNLCPVSMGLDVGGREAMCAEDTGVDGNLPCCSRTSFNGRKHWMDNY